MYDSLDRALGREPRKPRPLSFNGQRDTWCSGARTCVNGRGAGLYYYIHVHGTRSVLVRVPVRSRVARSNASAPTTVAQTVSIYVRIKILGYQIRARVRLGDRRKEKGMRGKRKRWWSVATGDGKGGREIRKVDSPLVLV